MLQLPDNEWRRVEVLASWIELSALSDDNAFVARGEVLDRFHDSALFDTPKREIESDSSVAGTAAAMAADVWQTLGRRGRLVGAAWPFNLDGDTLTRKETHRTLESTVAHTTMLLMEAAVKGWYKRVSLPKADRVRTHFEFIVAASLSRLCRGRTTRFGAPFPPGWPRGFARRAKHLADYFGLPVQEGKLQMLTVAQQQDASLDGVARLPFGDEEAGIPYLLVQCATSKNWLTNKLGQPMVALWREFVSWDGPVLKVVAVPFVLREQHELYKASLYHEYAIILDRLRISSAAPDLSISDELKTTLADWCTSMFGRIAVLGN